LDGGVLPKPHGAADRQRAVPDVVDARSAVVRSQHQHGRPGQRAGSIAPGDSRRSLLRAEPRRRQRIPDRRRGDRHLRRAPRARAAPAPPQSHTTRSSLALPLLLFAVYPVSVADLPPRPLPLAAVFAAAGALTAFCVNMRTSHTPIYLGLFACCVAALWARDRTG